MNKVELLTKVNTKINRMKIKGRKYSPEILLVIGVAGVVTGTVLACIATTKIPEIKEQMDDDITDMHKRLDTDESQTEEELKVIKKETTAIYFKTGAKYAGLYAPAVLVSGVSLSCLVVSNVILRKRLIGVSAAYAAVAQSFKEYRGRVAERYGDEIEKEIRYNIQTKEVTTTTVDGKGKEKTKTEKIKITDPNKLSDYAKVFDEACLGWTKDPQANIRFLKCQQAAADQRLKSQGYLFLNDVYEMLGFPKIPEGQVAGWIYDEEKPVGDNFVDFGLYDITRETVRNFINGYERNIILDFNIDGRILEFI